MITSRRPGHPTPILTHLDPQLAVRHQANADGTTLEAAVGMPFPDPACEEHMPLRRALEVAASGGDALPCETQSTEVGGQTTRFAHTITRPTGSGDLYVISQVIPNSADTERVADHAALLNRLLDRIEAGVMVFNLDTRKITYANRYLLDLFGHPLDEIPAGHFKSLLHPDDVAAFETYRQHVRPALPDGETYMYECRVIPAGGGLRWMSIRDSVLSRGSDGHVSEIVGVLVDITARKQLESELSRTSRWFEAVFSSTTDAVAISTFGADYDSSKLVRINKRVEEIYGMSLDELNAWSPSEAVPLEERAQAFARHVAVLEGQPPERFELTERRVQRKDGTIRTVESAVSVTRDDNGKPIELIAMARDITERKRRERQLADAKLAAEAALRARDAFVANISHDLRTPINTIQGYVQFLLDKPDIDPDVAQSLLHIDYSTEQLDQLINDVLDLSRVESGYDALRPTVFDPRRTVQRLQNILRAGAIRRRVRFAVDIKPDVPIMIRMDEVKFKQILINLVENAIKYSMNHAVHVEVSRGAGDTLRCVVSDSGAAGTLDDPTVRDERSSDGAHEVPADGLGIAISKRLVEIMGGTMTLTTHRSGTRVTVSLPFQAVAVEQQRGVTRAASDRRLYAVIVYDRADTPVLATYLEARGLHVAYVANADDITFIRNDRTVDLIVMDVSMPVEATAHIIERLRNMTDLTTATPIMTFTSEPSAERRAVLTQAGSTAVVLRPYRLVEVYRLLAHILRIEPAADPGAPNVGQLNAAQLTSAGRNELIQIPEDVLKQLRVAAECADHHAVAAIADELAESFPAFAQHIRHAADTFRASLLLDDIDSATGRPVDERRA